MTKNKIKRKSNKKPNCSIGASCGFGCIKKGLGCAGGVSSNSLNSKANQYADKLKEFSFKNQKIEKELGSGEFGSASLTSNGVVIKKGIIGENEVKALQELSPMGLTPEFIKVEKDSEPINGILEVQDFNGKLAMTQAKGSPITSLGEDSLEEVLPAYRFSMKKINLAGWAHNDPHFDNSFYDPDTKSSQLIDFGMATQDRMSILREAINGGTFPLEAEDWVDSKVSLDFLEEQSDRVTKTLSQMVSDGFGKDVLQSLTFVGPLLPKESMEKFTSIRESGSNLDEISKEQFEKYINLLYEDV